MITGDFRCWEHWQHLKCYAHVFKGEYLIMEWLFFSSSRRKNIVPHEYRRHFPTEMKDHNSHDILLLCTNCHAASNVHDGFLKQQLAEEFAAPQGCEEGVRLLEDSDRRRVRSAARALLTAGEGLPEQRREELQVLIKSFLNMNEEQELTNEVLQQAAGLETRWVSTQTKLNYYFEFHLFQLFIPTWAWNKNSKLNG